MDGWREGDVTAASLPQAEVNVTSWSLCSCFWQTQELTADLWSVAAVSIHTVPGSDFLHLSLQLDFFLGSVCVWLFVWLSLFCLSATCLTQWFYLAVNVSAGRADTSPCLVLFLIGEGHLIFVCLFVCLSILIKFRNKMAVTFYSSYPLSVN